MNSVDRLFTNIALIAGGNRPLDDEPVYKCCRACDRLNAILASTKLPFGLSTEVRHHPSGDVAVVTTIEGTHDPVTRAAQADKIRVSDLMDGRMLRVLEEPAEFDRTLLCVLRRALHRVVTHEIDEQITLPDGYRPFDPHRGESNKRG